MDKLENIFNSWLFEACEFKASNRLKLDAHDIYGYVEIPLAKACFMDGMSPLEFSKEIHLS